MLINKTLDNYIDSASNVGSKPGGGSILSLNLSLVCAINEMIIKIIVSNNKYSKMNKTVKEGIKKYRIKNEEIKKQAKLLIDEDANSFDDVLKAYKLPKESKEEIIIRNRKLEEGYKKATLIPYKTMELAFKILKDLNILASEGSLMVLGDVGINCRLLNSIILGSSYNIASNLNNINDSKFKTNIESSIDKIKKETEKHINNIINTISLRLDNRNKQETR